MKMLKIVQVAPFEESVPPKKYGGTELVVSNITEELIKRGHSVYLIATGDSKTSAKLIPVFPEAIRRHPEAKDAKIREAFKYIGVGRVINFLRGINADIVHNHIGWRLFPFAPSVSKPIITTLHGPLDVPYQKFVHKQFQKYPFVSISDSQRRPLPELNYVATVYNGIDVKKLKFNETPKDHFVFLGRMSPEKGPVQAIKIAKKAGVKLKMAAKVDTLDAPFFEKEVKPLIDGKQIEFIGEIKTAEKSNFLGNARGLIAPIQWEEPFGLFFTETMACGTPVITFNRGSVPEIIKDGKTGFIAKNMNEAVRVVKNIDKIERKECRKNVEEKFTVEKMVDGYEKVYYELTKGKK